MMRVSSLLSCLPFALVAALFSGVLAGAPVALAAPPPIAPASSTIQPVVARALPAHAAAPGPVKFGVYLYTVQELDFARHTFRATFNAWWRYRGDDFDPIASFQVVGARTTQVIVDDRRILASGEHYVAARVDVVIERVLDTGAFPFDKHQLRIEIESPYEVEHLKYVIDGDDSKLDAQMYSPGWIISDFKIHEERMQYPTGFGLPERGNREYSRAVVEVQAKRVGFRIVIDYFIGFFACVLICLLGYLVNPRLLAPRVTMLGTAVIAAVGNKYIINSSSETGLDSRIASIAVLASFAMVLTLMLTSIACERMIEAGNEERALRLNRVVGIGASSACALVLCYIVWLAARNL